MADRPRYEVKQATVQGMWIEQEGRMVDAVELTLDVPSASAPGETNPIRFVLSAEAAVSIAALLVEAAKPKGDPSPHSPPSALQ